MFLRRIIAPLILAELILVISGSPLVSNYLIEQFINAATAYGPGLGVFGMRFNCSLIKTEASSATPWSVLF